MIKTLIDKLYRGNIAFIILGLFAAVLSIGMLIENEFQFLIFGALKFTSALALFFFFRRWTDSSPMQYIARGEYGEDFDKLDPKTKVLICVGLKVFYISLAALCLIF